MGYWSSTTRVTPELGPSQCSDRTLVRAAQQGDKDAFQQLVASYDGLVLRLALHLTESEQDAQRIHQQVFVAAFAALPAYRLETSFFIWIHRLAAAFCTEHLRRQGAAGSQVARRLEIRQARIPIASTSGGIRNRFTDLSPRERLVFVLVQYHGLRTATIAEILQKPEHTVRDALSRAVCKLRFSLPSPSVDNHLQTGS